MSPRSKNRRSDPLLHTNGARMGHSFIHSLTGYVASSCSVPGTVLGDGSDNRDLSPWSPHAGAGTWTGTSEHVNMSGALSAGEEPGQGQTTTPLSHSLPPARLTARAPAEAFLWFSLSLLAVLVPGFTHTAPSPSSYSYQTPTQASASGSTPHRPSLIPQAWGSNWGAEAP